MTVGIGAAGILGIALETTSGTYLAPTKFIPFESESMNFVSDNAQRRPIRQSADIVGIVPGNVHVEGDIAFEALPDAVAILLHAARHTVVKTGASAPFTYTFTPNANALPVKTMSVTIVKNGLVFAYTGCVVGSFTFTVEDGVLKFNCTFQGRDEATQSAPTPTWPTSVPFGMGMYTIEIPTATQVFDTDTFEFQVEQNAEAQFRLNSAGARGAQFIKYGENEVSLSVERDFESKAEFAEFKALTAKTVTIKCVNGADAEIDLNIPVAIIDSYDVPTPSQGDLVRASISYFGVLDPTGKSYEIKVITTQDIT